MKKYQSFLSKKCQFLEVKFSIYLNRRVFVMTGKSYAQSGLNDHNGPENINYTVMKNRETFNGTHTTLTPAIVKILIFARKHRLWVLVRIA